MEWSPTLRRVVLLSSYVGPEPQVASFVREQLIAVDERATIVEAILDARAGNWVLKSIYDFLLQRTHLDLKTKLFLDRDGMDNLVEGMFDAALVGRLQALRLNCYSDIHEARSLIERFVSKCNGGSASAGSLWWDGVHPSRTAHTRWLSTRLEEDKDFELVLTDWLLDGERLQVWLDSCEESPGLVNNRDSLDDHVFATEVATQIMGLAKVRHCVACVITVSHQDDSCREWASTRGEERNSAPSLPGSSMNARHLVYSKQECLDLLNSFSITSPSTKFNRRRGSLWLEV